MSDPSRFDYERLLQHAAEDVWRAIPGYEGRYEVSRYGDVRRLTHSVMRSNGVPQRMNALTKKPQLKNSGYLYVLFGRDMHYVAHLVLTAFVGPRPPGKECCHNDGNKLNNAVENLRWDTRSENVRDIVRHGNHPQAEKEACSSGHPFDADNTYNRPNGARDCKECTRARGRKYRRRLRIEGEAA